MAAQPNPFSWAKAFARVHGPKDAYRIVDLYRRPMLGKDNDEPNPHAEWYERAHTWLKKNFPRAAEHHS